MGAKSRSLLLLDLDGTLVDSAPDMATAVNLLLGEEGAPPLPLSEVAAKVGDGARKLVARALAARGLPLDLDLATARFLRLYVPRLVEKTRPYPAVPEVLAGLSDDGWRLAVCTNKPLALTERILAELDLARFFAFVAGGDSFAVKKPDPEHLRLTLAALEMKPEEAVMLGDGRNDLLAAKAAGLPAIWAAYGYGGAEAAALPSAARVGSFAAVPETLRRLAEAEAEATEAPLASGRWA